MIRHSLLYLPAQVIGPLMQLVAMVVWTHLVSEHTLGVITLIIATHELLQVAFLAWWSQFALRFFGRFRGDDDAGRFYRTENTVLLASTHRAKPRRRPPSSSASSCPTPAGR